MQVSRLEAFGFKSFMDRLVLPLGSGVTGVVGPNGCGKSNIVDALRWVMGETRASQLRGDLLEDVIFNGSEKHRPLGLAEVTVSLRASGASLFEDVLALQPEEEVKQEVAPAVETVAQTPANEDEVEKPEPETREVFEEVATATADVVAADAGDPSEDGPRPLVAPKAEIPEETKAHTPAALTRFGWLQGVSEVQVTRRLYRSGESEYFINKVPCRLKDLREFFRVVGLGARGYTIIAQGEIGRIVTAKPEDRRMLIEEAAQVAGFREQITAVQRRLDESQTNVARLDDIIKEVTRQVGSLKRQAARAIARVELKAELKTSELSLYRDSLRRLSAKLADVEAAHESTKTEEAETAKAIEAIVTEETELRTGVEGLENAVNELRREIDSRREQINRRLRERSQREMRVRELATMVSSRTGDLDRIEERRVILSQRNEESKVEVTRLESEEGKLAKEIAEIDTSGEGRLRQLSDELQKMREEVRGRERAIRDVRDRMVSAQSRFEALQNQLVAASPTAQLQKTLASNDLPDDIKRGSRLLIDGLQVAPQYAKAVQAVLSERAGFLVAKDPFVVGRVFARAVLNRDPRNKKGAALGILRGESEAPAAGAEGSAEVQLPDTAKPLLSVVDAQPWCAEAVRHMLKPFYFVESIESAFSVLEQLPAEKREAVQLVTADGDIVTWQMMYSLRHDGGLVQMKVQIDEMQGLVEASRSAYEIEAKARDELQQKVTALEQQYSELLRYTQQCQAKARELSTSLGSVRGKLQAERRLSSQVEQDLERLVKQRADIEKQIGVLKEHEAEAQRILAELPLGVDETVEKEIAEFTKLLDSKQQELRTARSSADTIRVKGEALRRAVDKLRSAANSQAMDCQRVTFELSRLDESILKEYGEEILQEMKELAKSEETLSAEQRVQFEQSVSTVRARIHREGDVDPSSVEQYEVEQKRLDDLLNQRNDLEKAAETLRSTLGELTDACRSRFIQTFDAIRAKFQEFAPRLYGGGSADIVLVDPDRPLESGVDVAVRPPGKKLKSIDLLSGGEKALCATALVFAMFMSRPSPICVLDEVDAPLDEANVQRFLTFIKSLSDRTQFLMITHNKQSMASSDALVGVTMQEPGVTKTLSVSLQEAQKHAA